MTAAQALALLERAETTHQRADWRQAARALGAAVAALQAVTAEPAANLQKMQTTHYVTPPTPDEVETYREERERLAAPAAPSLIAFLAEAGIRDPGGELSGRDLDSWHRQKPFRRRLVRDDGAHTLESAAESAFEAGFFPDVPWSDLDRCPVTEDMLIAAIEREACGDFTRLYPRHDLRGAA